MSHGVWNGHVAASNRVGASHDRGYLATGRQRRGRGSGASGGRGHSHHRSPRSGAVAGDRRGTPVATGSRVQDQRDGVGVAVVGSVVDGGKRAVPAEQRAGRYEGGPVPIGRDRPRAVSCTAPEILFASGAALSTGRPTTRHCPVLGLFASGNCPSDCRRTSPKTWRSRAEGQTMRSRCPFVHMSATYSPPLSVVGPCRSSESTMPWFGISPPTLPRPDE